MPQSASAVADPYEGIATPIAAAPAAAAPASAAPAAPADTSDPYASIATPIPPPTDTGTKIEDQIHSAAQGVGAGAVTLGKEAWGMVPTPENLNRDIKGIWDASQNLNLPTEVLHVLPLVAAYENARSKGTDISGSLKAAAQHSDTYKQVTTAADSAEAAFKANPTKATAQALTVAIGNLAAMFGTGGASEAGAGEVAAEDAATASRMAAARGVKPGTLAPSPETGSWMTRLNPFRSRAAVEASAAQPGAEAAIHQSAGAGTSGAVLSGNETVLDKPLADLTQQAKTAYKKIDDTVGFDLKSEKAQLGNDEYNLKQLGNTPADQTQRKTLQASIADSTQRIQEAESKLRAAKINPDSGDSLFKKAQAGQDFKNIIVKATAPDGTINIDKLVNSAKTMRFAKRGDRLAQFMGGSDKADAFMGQLEAAQKAGQKAVTTNRIVTWLGHVGAIVGGYEGARQIVKPVLPE